MEGGLEGTRTFACIRIYYIGAVGMSVAGITINIIYACLIHLLCILTVFFCLYVTQYK